MFEGASLGQQGCFTPYTAKMEPFGYFFGLNDYMLKKKKNTKR